MANIQERYIKMLNSYWGIGAKNIETPHRICEMVNKHLEGNNISRLDVYNQIKADLSLRDRKELLLCMIRPQIGDDISGVTEWEPEKLETLVEELNTGKEELLATLPDFCVNFDKTSSSLVNELRRFDLPESLADGLSSSCLQRYCSGGKTLGNLAKTALATAKKEKERQVAEYLLLLWIRDYLATRGHNFDFLGKYNPKETNNLGMDVVCWNDKAIIVDWSKGGKVADTLVLGSGQRVIFKMSKDNLVLCDEAGKPLSKPFTLKQGKEISLKMDSPGKHLFASTTSPNLHLIIEVVDPECVDLVLPELPTGVTYSIVFLRACRNWILADQQLKKIESVVLRGEPLEQRCRVIQSSPPILEEIADSEDISTSIVESRDEMLREVISEQLVTQVEKALESDPIALQSFKIWYTFSKDDSLRMLIGSFDEFQFSDKKLQTQIAKQLTDGKEKDKLMALLRSRFA